MTETVQLELRDDATAVLRLNRPEVHNAVDGVVLDALEAAFDVLDAEDVRAVILTGAGTKTFCAGADLGYFASLGATAADGVAVSRRVQAVFERLGRGRAVIAALNGNVIGGGVELAIACHMRIAAAGIRFTFRPVALGLVPGWGGGRRLSSLVGRAAALRLLLLAATIDTEEALRLGLIDRVVEPDRVMEEAQSWARTIAAQPAPAMRALLELDGDAEQETRLFGELWSGEDFRRILADWRRRKGS